MGKFSIGKFVAPEKTNLWVDDVQELADATAQDAEASATFTISVKDEGKTVRDIRAAAKNLNKTVKIRVRNDDAVKKIGTKENGKAVFEGDVVLTISLVDLQKGGRGRKPGNGNGKSAEAEAPADVETPAKGK
jgi:hypothetical protein